MTSADATWLSEQQQRVWRQWLLANSELTAAIGRQLSQDSGMSLPDFQVLVRLSEAPGGRVRIVELADGMQWERSRLSHHLTRMEKRDLVARRLCPDDGRGAFAEITGQGAKAIAGAAPGHAGLVRSLVFDDLKSEDLAVIDRFTATLLDRLGIT